MQRSELELSLLPSPEILEEKTPDPNNTQSIIRLLQTRKEAIHRAKTSLARGLNKRKAFLILLSLGGMAATTYYMLSHILEYKDQMDHVDQDEVESLKKEIANLSTVVLRKSNFIHDQYQIIQKFRTIYETYAFSLLSNFTAGYWTNSIKQHEPCQDTQTQRLCDEIVPDGRYGHHKPIGTDEWLPSKEQCPTWLRRTWETGHYEACHVENHCEKSLMDKACHAYDDYFEQVVVPSEHEIYLATKIYEPARERLNHLCSKLDELIPSFSRWVGNMGFFAAACAMGEIVPIAIIGLTILTPIVCKWFKPTREERAAVELLDDDPYHTNSYYSAIEFVDREEEEYIQESYDPLLHSTLKDALRNNGSPLLFAPQVKLICEYAKTKRDLSAENVRETVLFVNP